MTKDMKKIKSIYYNFELFESLKNQIGTIQKSKNQIAFMIKGMKKIKSIYYKLELTEEKKQYFFIR